MAAVADGDDELEGLCVRAQGGDRSALRRVSDAAWANEPHRCGDGVALSPLWGLVEGGTERELVKVLMGRAAHGEEECREEEEHKVGRRAHRREFTPKNIQSNNLQDRVLSIISISPSSSFPEAEYTERSSDSILL